MKKRNIQIVIRYRGTDVKKDFKVFLEKNYKDRKEMLKEVNDYIKNNRDFGKEYCYKINF